jgi:serine/threonine-protein kinase
MTKVAALPQTTFERGTTFDRYELLCHLAQGGMANVWLARMHSKPEFERLFAIKTVLPAEAENPEFRAMFLDEARLVSRIDHPNVARVSDVGEHQGLPYLVMELIEGDSLDKLVRDVRDAGEVIPLGIALRIAADACNGLAAAHDLVDAHGQPMNVVHRDVSPQNILVATTGLSKVIDFGIAKGRDRISARTSTGVLKGKASYMPREQACGEEVDARTDTWALGAVLYYLFAGHAPYKSKSELATLRMAITAAPIAPLPPDVPGLVRALVAKALRHDPKDRFQTAGDMAVAVENVMRALGATASYNEVGTFVRRAMAARLAVRRELVSLALIESTNRESVRFSAAAPVEVEVVLEAPGRTFWGAALRSITSSLPKGARSSRTRLVLAAVAALWVVVVGMVSVSGRGRAPSATRQAPEPKAGAVAESVPADLPVPAPVDEFPPPPAPATLPAPPVEVTAAAATSATPPRAHTAAPRPAASAAAAATHSKNAPKPAAKSRDDEAGF